MQVLGPFFVEGAPVLPNGADMTVGVLPPGEPTWFAGRVSAAEAGTGSHLAVPGATVDVWQTRPDAKYDVQVAEGAGSAAPDLDSPHYQLRGRFVTDAEGQFSFKTYVRPALYCSLAAAEVAVVAVVVGAAVAAAVSAAVIYAAL